ncbi:Pleiotropic drug resistance proteins (PDR1-15), ABC superfamily [Handroanthus impetiginosus]|uniref:Pleiotropic drug resistance proteins (PDR1-15), ABC superfamily n=1 Tax=Handroanthus impetiginosus TaxID=429701 RepID=A0A2G9GRZ4_9LAMI|nr:Pleiotropic drug resistance proteins (PDR1-15), ABC superfamily [Handroanthus impetiginosus]
MFSRNTLSNGTTHGDDDEEGLMLAALERSPTYDRARTALFRNVGGELSLLNVRRIKKQEQREVLDKLVNAVNEDIEGFFRRIRQRFDAVGLEFPKVEVRFQNLKVDALVHVGSRALPTIPNFIFDMTEAFLRQLGIFSGRKQKYAILNNINGIIRPSRLTLLLGPPSSGKTTLLLALAGRLAPSLQMSGKITYNGHDLREFTPQRTSAYASQQDWHIAEMTVKEVLEFSGHCQGSGFKHELLMELLRREKIAGINPDQDLDIFIKAVVLGQQTGFLVEYIMKILGLDICADTLVGDEMLKGISGGQKKRLTTAELLMGASRVLFLDEISTGLDSSTTHQIINYLRHTTHAFDCTTLVSLLQPDPETYEMFDDVILLSEGQIVYHGPREAAVEFFAFMGFKCPSRKNVADFLQEVISEKDQEQYWFVNNRYNYVPLAKFVEGFQSFRIGNLLAQELAVTFDKQNNHPAALSTKSYGISRAKLLRISFSWQMLLLKRNSPVFIFKFIQLLLIIVIMMSVFFRTTMHHNSLEDGGVYLGALYFAIVMILFNGFMEVPMLIAKLPVLYKHRDLRFYPCWIYTLPSWFLSIPLSLVESFLWVAVTYYAVGFDPQITRCLLQFLLYFTLHQMSIGLFRVMASLGRNMVVANTFGSFAMLVVMVLGGFILSRDSIPVWWIWGYWISPMMYAQSAASVNEFLGPSWDMKAGNNTTLSLGEMLLKVRSLFPDDYWYWIGVGALLGYTLLFNTLFTLFLSHLNPLGSQQAVIPTENRHDKDKEEESEPSIISFGEFLQHSHSFTGKSIRKHKGMVLPFQPLSMCFSNISYYVDVPLELKGQGIQEERLQLLVNVTGAFRPGVLTALIGVSGAGKTTLMDVLAGRKTGGHIEGRIYISGYPKNQESFARISGYCEQNDVHSPCLTVHESLVFSAWLRLSSQCDFATQRVFVDEVMELVELTPLRKALVGIPGVNGLSVEQRKRLTIAVELVANPSIVFMDEPTSGLDARAAAIVMRAVRNIVNTGRTIVCTIHQPSIDIFESFDELLLMKRGGQLIYAGPLGSNSIKLIQYFEAIPGVQKIRPGYNPATWVLEVTSPAEENRLGLDFAEIYRRSNLFQQNKDLVESLSKPDKDTNELIFPSKYSLSFFGQFLACLWKQNLSYWRNPQYTAVRFFYTVIISLMFGTICWKFGSKRETQQDIFNAMGSMYAAVLFIGITNATSVQPVVYVERFVSYRERAAGMYSPLPFAFAQVAVEFPYVLVQSLIYSTIFYFMASFEWNKWKFLWYICFMYFTLLYFTFFGMMTISITPNHNVAAIVAAPFYMMWNLFSGFMVSRMRIPIWWRWYYWANPIAWSLYGLLTSQYGDLNELVKLTDGVNSMPIKQLLKDQFGFRHEFLGVAGIVVVGFCLIFAVTFAFAIKSFNFQRR